jgi:hypothetical protein
MIWLILGSPLLIVIAISLYFSKNKNLDEPEMTDEKIRTDTEIAKHQLYNTQLGGSEDGSSQG